MDVNNLKIGLFSDSHYSSAALTCGCRYNNQSLRKIGEALRFFAEEQCDLVIILGDVTDTEPSRAMEEENLRQIAQVLDQMAYLTVWQGDDAQRPV